MLVLKATEMYTLKGYFKNNKNKIKGDFYGMRIIQL